MNLPQERHGFATRITGRMWHIMLQFSIEHFMHKYADTPMYAYKSVCPKVMIHKITYRKAD